MSKLKMIFLLLTFTMLANLNVQAQSPGGDPPAPFNVTGAGSYCSGGVGLAVGLDGSEVGVTYTLYKGTVAQTPTVDGTGSAISFGNQLVGTYTIKGANQLGETDMTGNAVLTIKPTLTISSQSTAAQTKTINGTFAAISVTASELGSTYQWYKNTTASTTGGTSLGSDNGAQTDSYTPQATSLGTLYYYCDVTGACETVTSNVSGAFVVNDNPPSALSYTTPNIYTINTAISSLLPTVSGGAVVSYSISPALPDGLSINATTGEISGTPTAFSAATDYTVTATNSGGNTTAVVNIKVNKIVQTITFNTLTNSTYGDADFSLGATASSGLSVSYSSNNTAVATVSGSTVTIVGAGSATITASQSGDAIYGGATSVDQVLTVDKKSLSITGATAANKNYDGTDVATLTTGTLVGVVGSDDVSINKGTGTFDTKNVGNTKTVTAVGYSLSGTKVGNYTLSAQPGSLTANITAIPLTITAEDKTKEYDGAVYSPFTVTYSGFASGDDATSLGGTLSFSGTASTAKNAGTAYVITPGGLTSSNYTITFVDGKLDITKKALTITAEDKTKEYDGAVYSPFTVTYSGFASGDDATSLGGILSFSGTASTAKNAGTAYVITPGGLTSSNYTITFVDGKLDITKKALTITAEDKTKEYDGAVYSPFTVTYSGFASGDDATSLGGILSFSGTASTAKNAGTAYVITPGGLTSSNYTISFVDGKLDITKKALTITAEDKTKEYDGAVYSPFTVTYSGFASGDDATSLGGALSFSGTASTAKNAGTAYVITPGGLTSSNYTITFVDGKLDITKKALTITAEDKTKEYDGAVYSPFTVTYSGFASGDDATSLGGILSFSGTASTAKNAGIAYVITPGGLTSSNYTISFVDGKLDITKKALTITAEDKTKEYDGAVYSPFTVTYSGFASGDDATSLGGTLSFSGTASTAKNAGTAYVITPGGLTSSNYTIAYVDGKLDITKKALTITAEDKTKEYDGAVYSPFTVTYSGFASGDDATSLGGTLSFSGTASTAKNVGTAYVITPGGLTSSNYTIAYVDGKLDITKKALTITAEDKTKEYDGAVYSPFTVTYSGFASGDDATSLGGTLSFSGTASTAKNAGTAYVITPGGLTSSNYTIAFVDGKLDITKKTLTITAEDKTKEYDGAVYSPFTVTYSGFASGDDATSLGGTLSFSGSATSAINGGTAYVITPGGLTSSNYTISFVDGKLDITKKAQSIVFNALPNKTIVDPDFSLNAISSSGLAVTYTSSNTAVATISGSTLRIVGVGNTDITASQNGDTNYSAASSITQNLIVTNVPPQNLRYSTPVVYVTGKAITSMTPSYTEGVPTNYSVSPALPAGLTLNSTSGVISGTPSAVTASANYLVTASNIDGSTSFTVNITVNDVAVTTGVAPSNLSYSTPVVYVTGKAITSMTPSVSGGAVTSYSVSPALPAGLTINSTSGVISGTPSAVTAKSDYLVTASNADGSTSFTVNITVNDVAVTTGVAPSNLSYSTPVVYVTGKAITSMTPSVSGGAVTTYAVSPSLPTGLSLDAATGVISGTPSAVTAKSDYLVTASNADGSTSFTVNITVNDVAVTTGVAPSNLSYSTPVVYVTGKTIASITPSISGGAVTSYSVSQALPAGLTINSTTGVISGTPSAVTASANYLVTASNADGSTSFTVNITVNDVAVTTGVAPSNLSYSTPVVYVTGKTIASMTPSVSGGAVTSYSVSPALPAGLIINSTSGVISGTPSAVTAKSDYLVTASNADGSTSFTVNITVNDVAVTTGVAPSNLSYSTPVVYVTGKAITSMTPSVSGGAATTYTVSPSLPTGLSLDAVTGVISGTPSAVTAKSDYLVTATNADGSTSFTVNITVNDVAVTTGVAPSNLSYSTPVVYVTGKAITSMTPSVSGGAVTSYSVSQALPAGLTINSTTGVISGTPSAVTASANYLVTASNADGSTSFTVNITVNDVAVTTGVAPSNLSYSTPVVYVTGKAITSMTPSVSGGAVTSYSVSPALPAGLTINSTSGVISGTPSAVTAKSDYLVTASNADGSTSFTVNITVNDVAVTTGVAPSNLSYSTPVVYVTGKTIASITPSISGGAVTSYSVSQALPAGLTINSTTGVISGTPSAVTASANYLVTASNADGSTSFTVNITVNDVAVTTGVAPSNLSYSTPVVYVTGKTIASMTPSVSGGAVTTYTVSPSLPTGLSLDAATGVISGTPSAVTAKSDYLVTASNADGSTSFTVNITVNDVAVTTGVAPSNLSYSTPVVYVTGKAITSMTPSVSGGAATTYTVSPSLPTGLSLDAVTGVISGTPSAVTAKSDYLVTATNADGSTSFTVNITVNDVAVTTGVAPSNLSYSTPVVYVTGKAITSMTPSVSGGAATTYTVSPSLPTGLSLDAVTGVISGTPSAVTAKSDYLVTATNADGSTSFTVNITVNDVAVTTGVAPSNLSYSTPVVYVTGKTIASMTPSVSGGAATTYTVSPSLPTGLSLDAVTGVISGTPSAVTAKSDYLVTATNADGSTSFTVNITVNDVAVTTGVAPSNLSYSTPVVYVTGKTIASMTPSVSGGAATTYTVSPSLPTGLSLDAVTGVISGTPSAVTAKSDYLVTATNADGSTSFTVNITVNDVAVTTGVAPSNLSYSTPVVYVTGKAITSMTPSISGGAVTAYAVSPALPAGLTINNTSGVISGTPSAVTAKSDYLVTATNADGSTSFTVNITVNNAAVTTGVAPSNLSYSTPVVYVTGKAIASMTPSVSGGAVTSYSVSPALPAGLTLNSTSGVISGTPSAVTASANYLVTASNADGSTSFTVNITVNDVAVTTGVAPSNLSYSTPVVYVTGKAIASMTPSVSGGAVTSYSVSPALPAGLTINSTSGVISGTPSAVTAKSDYLVTASNADGSTSFTVNITVNDVAVTTGVAPSNLSYSTPVVYVTGKAITSMTPGVSGGAVTTYAVSPSLPTGLSLDAATGVISGTPSAVTAKSDYLVTATNADGSTSFTVNITVNDVAVTTGVAPSNLSYSTPVVYVTGKTIASMTPSISGGAVTSYSVSPSLPTGLSLDAVTGVIIGTPSAVTAKSDYLVTASNADGTTSFTVNITVNDVAVTTGVAPSNLSYSTPVVYVTGKTIASITPSISGGAVTSYSVSPALPAGLTINSTTGVISGTPSAVTAKSDYLVTATNADGSTSFTVNITVNDVAVTTGVAPSNLSYSTPVVYVTGKTIASMTPSVSGGAVTTYTVSPSLPTGLSLDAATGVISGTPSAVTAKSDYLVTASNADGSTSFTVNITVNDVAVTTGVAPSNLSYSTPVVYVTGKAITSMTPSVSGGAATTYTVSPSLPTGLSLDAVTGVISGTPSAVTAKSDYLVTATNADGSTSFTVNITVNDVAVTTGVAPSNLSYSTPVVYVTGKTIASITPSISGGAVTSYSVSQALPAGLTINSTTGVISGTPSAVTASANYLVTASNADGSTSFTVNITVNDVAVTTGVAPSNLSYSTPVVYVTGKAITSMTPSVSGGAATTYTVSPSLPTGLSLDAVTGVISGTPSAVTAKSDYLVTATNADGSTSFTENITVNDVAVTTGVAPSNLSYSTPVVYVTGKAIASMTPSVSGGAVTSYSVSPALPAGLTINSTSGVISGTPSAVTAKSDYLVTASNADGSTSFTVNITVNDVAVTTGVAPSNLSYSTPVVYVTGKAITSMTPSVSGGAVTTYAVSPSLPTGLSLDAATGVISGTPSAVTAKSDYLVTASNADGSTSFTVNITVNDVAVTTGVAPSNLSYSTPVVYVTGKTIASITPSISGGAVTSYSVSQALPAGLTINSTTGVISGTPSAVTASANYLVTASNADGSTSFTVNITVNDVAVTTGVAPSNLSYSTPVVYVTGKTIASMTPSVSGGAVTTYTVSPSLPTGLSLDAATGVISGTPSAVTAKSDYLVTASNADGSTSFTVNITVNDVAVTTGVAPSNLSYSTPVVYVTGKAITSMTPSVSGGAATTYTVSPSLPTGLSLDAVTGVISGTPSAVTAKSDYLVTATNADGSTSFTVNITVNDVAVTTGVAPSNLSYSTPVVYVTGKAITSMTPSVSGGAVTSYSVSQALPAGLTINSTTGVISGTPSAVTASANYLVTASNADGSTSFTVNITVNDVAVTTGVAPSNLSYSTPVVYVTGKAIASMTPSISGGAVTAYAVSPALPAGLTINNTSGVISGTPSAVTAKSDYLVTATNADGSTSFTVNITVNNAAVTTGVAPSNLSYSTPVVYVTGKAIASMTPSVSGGAVTSYSVSPALPAGLTLNSTSGVISGTPSAVTASANYLVTASNADGSTSFTVNITVNDVAVTTGVAPSNLSYSTPVVYVTGKAIASMTPSVSGGAVTSYSVSPALPAGLTINSTSGVISGTPSAVTAKSDYLVTASNADGSTSFTVNITVNDVAVTTGVAPSNLSYSTPVVYVTGKAITSMTPGVSGGAVTTYAVSPSLPTGLSLDAATGVISGTPSAVTAKSDYLVTATNADGSTSFTVNITVNDVAVTTGVAPSNLSYSTPVVYVTGKTIASMTPSISGGAVTSYSVSPSLPTGLSLDAVTGVIIGTPSAVTAKSDYLVTASNADGTTSFTVNITVNDVAVTTGVAPSNLSYSTPVVYVTGKTIASITPSISGGAVTSYSVSPALPAGLTINSTTGVISGTPSAVTAKSDYLVTATNADGSTSFTVNITVNDVAVTTGVAPSNLSYSTPVVYVTGKAITSMTPSVSGGAVTSYSVSPALPAGLTINNTSGVISGTPSAVTAKSDYRVTATNADGSTSFTVNITVNDVAVTTGVAPSNLSYSTPVVYVTGKAITSMTPSISGGAVTSYSASPSLPTGLSLDAATGVISGTPSAVTAKSDYLVTASNAYGSTTFTVNITIKTNNPIAGDINEDGKIVFPEITGDVNGDKKITPPEIAGDGNGDGKITAPEIAGDVNGDGVITAPEIAGDVNGDEKITSPEIVGDSNGDGKIDGNEITGDANGDGNISNPEIKGDSNGDGTVDITIIAGDVNGDGKITAPEIAGDVNGDGKITSPEIAGDVNGDGKITSPEILGDSNGDGKIDGTEITGDANGDGNITSPEIKGDSNGDGTVDITIIAGDVNGDGKITAPEIAGDVNGDGSITAPEIAGDVNGDGKITPPEIVGDTNGDGKIDGTEILGDSNGDGKITSTDIPLITMDPINNATPIEGCENTNIEFGYSVLTGSPVQYKITFDLPATTVGIQNISYTNLPGTSNAGTISFAIPNGIPDGIYKGTLQLKDAFGIESASYEFQFMINVSSKFIVQKFDDVVLCDNSSNRFTSYQWFKNGVAISGATNQFYCDPNGLVGVYSLEVVTKDGQKLKTCQKEYNIPLRKQVIAYPNPVQANQECVVKVEGFEEQELESAKLTVYNISGNSVYNSEQVKNMNSLNLPSTPGVYMGRVTTSNGKAYEFKVIVKK